MTNEEVEEELRLDRMVYGTCFWKEVDGRKVRIHPRNVIIKDGHIYSTIEGEIHGESSTPLERAFAKEPERSIVDEAIRRICSPDQPTEPRNVD